MDTYEFNCKYTAHPSDEKEMKNREYYIIWVYVRALVLLLWSNQEQFSTQENEQFLSCVQIASP